MKPKEKNTLLVVFVAIAAYVFCILWSMMGANYMDANPSPDTSVFIALFKAIGESNMSKNFGPNFWSCLGGTTLVYFIGAVYAYLNYEREKSTHPNKEHGSSDWNTDLKKYNKKYTAPYGKPTNNSDENAILSQNVFLGMNGSKTMRNLNTIVIGGSGAGKSRFYVKPNLLQLDSDCSYVITDPSGELIASVGKPLQDAGYTIKIFNLVDMRHSNCYNPFEYIRDDTGVIMLINCLIKNTTPGGAGKGDPFWEKSETALLQALVFYLIKYRPKEEQNFTSVMKLLRAAEVDENNPNAKSPLDMIFEEVKRKDPNSIALKQYQTFKMGAGKTLKSILISCSVRLTVFNLEQIENLTRIDTLELDKTGDRRTALFVIIPQADDTYNFLASMMYSQLFETLYYHAEYECENHRLKHHTRLLLDEFANIGQIPDFTNKLATMRKYQISCSVILQNLAQLKKNYKDDWEGMVGNCDSMLFLGGQELSTLEHISKKLGKKTIRVRNNSRSMGSRGSHSLSYNKMGRELMTPDELMTMDNNECIVIVRGLKPFRAKKYEYTKHPNYHLTGDANKKYTFDYRSMTEFDNAPRITVRNIETALKEKNAEEIISKPHSAVLEEMINKVGEEIKEEAAMATAENPGPIVSALMGENGVESIEFKPISTEQSGKEKRKEEKEKQKKACQDQEEWMFSAF